MPRVVPSQVVELIDQMFPFAATQIEVERNRAEPLTVYSSGELSALLDLIEGIPNELISLQGRDYLALVSAVAAIRDILEIWRSAKEGEWVLSSVGGFDKVNAVTLIRRCLEKCRDEAPPSGTAELTFIGDQELRESIRLDVGAAYRDLTNGEWKGATVLAGSALEALLLWALQQHEAGHPGAVAAAARQRVTAKLLPHQPPADLEKWELHQYIEIAEELGIIKQETAVQARQAKNFRNLIHPGRVVRLGQKCDRGTAFAALSAVYFAVRDLTS